MKSLSVRSLGALTVVAVAMVCSVVIAPRSASATAVTITAGGLTSTSTPVYTNPGLATTTRATTGDTVQYQLTLDGTPLVAPQINIFSMGSTTMSGAATAWYYATTTAAAWSNGLVSFKISVGGTAGDATTTLSQADVTTDVTFDNAAPTLSSVAWTDTDSSTQFSATDTFLLTFSETMATTTLTAGDINTVLGLTNSHIFSTTTAPTWNTAGTQLTITLGAGTTVTNADTVQPTIAVKDAIGNTASGAQTAIVLPDAISPSDPTGLSDTSFHGATSVILASAGSSQIRYTTDGTTPSCSVGLIYSSTIVLSGLTTMKAIGCDEVPNASAVVTAVYTYTSSGNSSGTGSSYHPPVVPAVPATPASPSSSGLTSEQVTSILAVLASFDADAATIASVRAALSGSFTGSVTSVAVHLFKSNLTAGSLGSEVKALQMFLNAHGYSIASSGPGSSGNETDTFGGLTRAALVKYQKAKGITPAVGYFGAITRAAMNAE